MDEHSAGSRHYRLDSSLGNTIVVVGSNTGKAGLLLEGTQVFSVLDRSESRTIIGQVAQRYNTKVLAGKFKLLFGLECLVCVEMSLHLHMDVATGMVDEDATA